MTGLRYDDDQPLAGLSLPPGTRVRSKASEDARRSFTSMVDLALERGNADSVGDLLDQIAALRQYRPFNALLAVLQRPRASMLLSQETWEVRWRRRVKRHEHPVVLLVPGGPVMFLFDVSQTEAVDGSRRLPARLENPYAMDDVAEAGPTFAQLVANIRGDGVRVGISREGWKQAGCIQLCLDDDVQSVAGPGKQPPRAVPVRWHVTINGALSPTEQLATLAHELGHLYCGHVGSDAGDPWPERLRDLHAREYEAESVARLVFRRLAPDVELPPYLEPMFGPDAPVPAEVGWTHVVRAAERVLENAQP